MSDWGMYEIEDIVWGELDGNDDHIVPHHGGTTVSDSVNKRITDGKTSVTKNVFLEGQGKSSLHSNQGDGGEAPMLEKKSSWFHIGVHENACSAFCGSESINSATDLTPEESKTSDNCFRSSNVDSVGDHFCTGDPIRENGDEVVDNSWCHFQLDDISAAASDLEYFGNGHDQKESSDLFDYGWSDIGNFEDVDKMFRNCDFTFGPRDTGSVNELLWFSTSSHAIDHLDDTPKSGFRPSYGEGRVLKSTPEDEIDTKLMPAADHLAITDFDNIKGTNTSKKVSWNSDARDFCAYANGFAADTKNKRNSASIDQVLEDKEPDEVNISSQAPISNESGSVGCQGTDLENVQSKQSRSQEQLAGKRKTQSSEFMNGTLQGSGPAQELSDCRLSSSVSSSSQVPSQQRQLRRENSRYLHAYNPYRHQEYGHPSHHFSVTQTGPSIKSETENPPRSFKVLGHASNDIPPMEISSDHQAKFSTEIAQEKGQGTFTDQVPIPKQLHQVQDEDAGDSEVAETGIQFAPTEIDSSTIQESSCMSSSLSNKISLEATGFHQLQDVMGKLDIRTKLCIRDSLYRLARSAKQRHDFCKIDSSNGDRRAKNGTPAAGESNSNKYLGLMDPETDTNPMDRSIAHLLFYRPSRSYAWPSGDALSLESQGIIHGSTTNLPKMHNQLVCQEDSTCDPDTKLPITE